MPARKVSSIAKKRRGTDQPCRASEGEEVVHQPLDEAPDPPDYLDVYAQEYWNEIAPLLVAKKALSNAHLGALEVLCVLKGKFVKAATAGYELNGSMFTQLRLYQESFGLTPVSQSKVMVGETGKKGNAFQGRGRKGK